ncbi:MAG TPA: HAMP domain-containing sensor histidine kinase [Gaiellaceae bacterium]|nr:HAMP domain-containing sensor histidine kinase [Gaiellaceae bacterium]
MLGSLRFRLPAFFLLGVVIAGLVATVISIRFFQSYTRTRTIHELRSESIGIVSLYASQAGAQEVPVTTLRKAIGGDRIFYVPVVPGASLFAGPLPHLPVGTLTRAQLASDEPTTLNIHVSGTAYLAVAEPVTIGKQVLGALVVAKPASQLRSGWLGLLERLAIAFGGGVLAAGLIGVYLTRRIARPLLALSAAADEIAAGEYGVEVPQPRGHDEIAQLSSRFADMAAKLGEAEQLSRMFLMSVSHELRTPLTAIRGHVSALREGVIEDPEAYSASLAVIEEEAIRLERLVGDVLDLAKLNAHRFAVLEEEVDMRELCERAYAAFGEVARQRGIDYRRDFTVGPVIVTDGDRVLQVISNLLSNAFRWTPEGGRISLALGAENGSVSVVVSDSGPGISPEERERIFRPFWSRDGGGTGLGLAIARELAFALGGRIDLRSEPGLGARFELTLPL